MNSAWFLLAFLMVIFAEKGQSIKCYQCSSVHDTSCGDDFRLLKDSTVDCTGSCVKYREYAHSHTEEQVDISRGCQPHREGSEGCRESVKNHREAHSCFCNSDYCNTGVPGSLPDRITVLSLTLLSVLWYRM